MKKLLLILQIFIIGIVLRANPLPVPSIALSELIFDSGGKWTIELQYFNAGKDAFDSIWIKTSSGTSTIKKFEIIGSSGVIIIRNDSLVSPLNINPKEDSIEISYKSMSHKVINNLIIYGNSLNAQINSPRIGQSIAGILSYASFGSYCLDNSPTLGSINDTVGMCGIIKGKIYDKNNALITNTSITLEDNNTGLPITINSDGTYSMNMYSCKDSINSLFYLTSLNKGYKVNIVPIIFTMEPDSVIEKDIHILDSLKTGINDLTMNSESIIKLFPNPLNGLDLNFDISIPVRSSICYISLIDLNGKKIAQYQIKENTGIITVPSNIKNGLYSVLLFVNDKNYSNAKIVISRLW